MFLFLVLMKKTKIQERWYSVHGLKMVCQWLKITETLPLMTPVRREAEGRTVLIEQNLIEYALST